MPHAEQSLLEINTGGEPVPAILLRPPADRPVAGVVLLHGFNSSKTRMADSFGRSLLLHGVASLAIDLPLHGARGGDRRALSLRNPLALVQHWRRAVRDANAAVQYLASHPGIDGRRVAIAGYSLGAYLALATAATNPLVRAVALASGGDLPAQTPFVSLIRTFVDPIRAVSGLRGRPLFMTNGLNDHTIVPDQARALFAAASEPKEIHWYAGGHRLMADAAERMADWLASQLGAMTAQSRTA